MLLSHPASGCPPAAPLAPPDGCHNPVPVKICGAPSPPAPVPVNFPGQDCTGAPSPVNALPGEVVEIVQRPGQALTVRMCSSVDREVVKLCNAAGQPVVVQYDVTVVPPVELSRWNLATGAVEPAGALSACDTDSIETVSITGCINGLALPGLAYLSDVNGVPSVLGELWRDPATGIWGGLPVGASASPCVDCVPIVSSVLGCLREPGGAAARSVVIHYEYRLAANGNTELHATRYTEADGVTHLTLTPGQTVTPGACPLGASSVEPGAVRYVHAGGVHIANGIFSPSYDPDGNGPTFDPVVNAGGLDKLQSFTVICKKGSSVPSDPNVVLVEGFGVGMRIRLGEGESYSWSVAQDNGGIAQLLDAGLLVTCQGHSAAVVTFTMYG